MRPRKLVAVTLGVLIVSAITVVAATARPTTARQQAATPFKVAWIYTGPHNDGGWSQAHEAGRQYVQKVLGNAVQTTYKENIPNSQVPQVVAGLVHDGYKLIFGTSYGFFEGGQNGQLYKKYPDVLFEQATGLQIEKNQAEYYGAGEDGIYLSGMAAGAAMTASCNTVGYVVPFAIPEVIRHINAFTLGVQATHPGAKVAINWTNSWYDPGKETKAADVLVKTNHACVLGQNVDSPATGQYAKKHGIPWAGYDSNASSFAPNNWLTAATYNWGPYYLARVKAAMNGTWKPGFYYGSLKDGFVHLAKFGPHVSAKTKALITAREKAIEKGSFYEFAGPIKDQAGKLMVKSGQRLTVKDLYAINWLVQGVVGSSKG